MGTGTPAVTTSGLSAANAVLKKYGIEPFAYREGMKNYVRIVDKPFTNDQLFSNYDEKTRIIMKKAMRCRLCEHPSCSRDLDVRGIMRRTAVGNFSGANKIWLNNKTDAESMEKYENNCICKHEEGNPVEIRDVIKYISGVKA